MGYKINGKQCLSHRPNALYLYLYKYDNQLISLPGTFLVPAVKILCPRNSPDIGQSRTIGHSK